MSISPKHQQLKDKAVKLRLKGQSYRQISNALGVARSTLNGWLKDVILSKKQRQRLRDQWIEGLAKARTKSCQVKKDKKLNNMHNSQVAAQNYMQTLSLDDSNLELFLSGLYLGDGFKVNGRFGLGNSNPQIVKLFLTIIRQLYPINESKLGVQIFARADQNADALIDYWSNLLSIPKSQFQKTQHDKRTKNQTRPNYYGVCAVNYSDVDLQRRILAIGNEMLKYKNKPNKGL